MGSDLFQVRVLAKKGTNAALQVVSVHPDSGAPPANESFVIQLLEEASSEGAFAAAVSFNDSLDSAWQTKYARGFISSVKATATKAGRRPSATLEITVTHPAWLAHIEKGSTWDSRAFIVTSRFSACEPIVPEVGETLVERDDDDDFWILVPRCAWEDMDIAPGPDLLLVPAYAPTSYAVKETINKPTSIPKEWIGRAVRLTTASRTQDCVLLAVGAGGRAEWARMTDGSYGTGKGPVDSIGLLAPKKGRHGSRMSYQRLLGRRRARLVDTRRDGKVVELRYRIAPDLRTLNTGNWPPSQRKRVGLDTLRSGLVDTEGALTTAGAATALGQSLIAAARRHGVEGWELDEKIAGDYIEKVEILAAEGHDLDAMPLGEVRAILSAEWPIATMRITATDAQWIAHIDEFPPTAMHTEVVEPKRKAKEPAARARPARAPAKPAARAQTKPARAQTKPAAKATTAKAKAAKAKATTAKAKATTKPTTAKAKPAKAKPAKAKPAKAKTAKAKTAKAGAKPARTTTAAKTLPRR
ncbi:MAG: hypothetical protein JNL82_35485 [Myxococcales bacterium]|nr:hypothetical protein [Myxococcales bacterium]